MQSTTTQQPKVSPRDGEPNKLLYSLMITAIIMPLTGWMLSVSLPIIRDDFNIAADVAAWIATAFTLPFMILMPVYGRISDSLGKRRLLLTGTLIFILGSIIVTFSINLAMLLLGRVIQGVGVAGLLPLSLALITEVFPPLTRGKAMGKFSTIGPLTGAVGPILAGFIVAAWGWRAAFVPPAIFAVIGLIVVYVMIPSSTLQMRFSFLSTFDWIGVGLLSVTLTFLLFYFSSRPITGVPPLQDWRLLGLTCLFLVLFGWYENRKTNPFINLQILKNRPFIVASICAGLRMIGLSGGFNFLAPLYLADVMEFGPTLSGFFLMTNPAAMTVVVRFGGNLSDRRGSRVIVMTGFGLVSTVMFAFSQISGDAPYWVLITLFLTAGVGAGLMLAALHRAALNNVPEAELGISSGIYSMIRFLGSACGAVFGGILLQFYLNQPGSDLLAAYQHVFLWFAGFALTGSILGTFLPKTNEKT